MLLLLLYIDYYWNELHILMNKLTKQEAHPLVGDTPATQKE